MDNEFDSYDHEIITSTGQYENIKTHYHGSFEAAVEAAKRLQNLVRGGGGLAAETFNAVLDRYLHEQKGIEESEWTQMNKAQQDIFQAIKRSIKRNNYKTSKQHHE